MRLQGDTEATNQQARSLLAETGSPRDESVRLADWKPIFQLSIERRLATA
jgi:hypothetical protein